jgi:hypothetical protein
MIFRMGARIGHIAACTGSSNNHAQTGHAMEDLMIKDVIVNLTVDASRDAAADFAISVARTFGAHLAGIGFAHEVPIPGSIFGPTAVRLVEAERAENERAARNAIAGFDAATHRVGLSAESHFLSATLPAAAATFGRLAGASTFGGRYGTCSMIRAAS